MYKNRSNRPAKDLPRTQGYKNYETGETHAPLNNHEPRVGVSKWKHRRKCHCELCGGNKRNKISEENWRKDIDKEMFFD